MPHYLDEYAPKTGRWQAESGRRYNLIVIDLTKTRLRPGRTYAITDTEDAAALHFGFTPATGLTVRRRTPRKEKHQPANEPRHIVASQSALFKNYVRVESLNITPTAAVQLARWAESGNAKAKAVSEWVNAHWAEYRVKQAAIATGQLTISFNPSSLWKPYRFEEIAAEMM